MAAAVAGRQARARPRRGRQRCAALGFVGPGRGGGRAHGRGRSRPAARGQVGGHAGDVDRRRMIKSRRRRGTPIMRADPGRVSLVAGWAARLCGGGPGGGGGSDGRGCRSDHPARDGAGGTCMTLGEHCALHAHASRWMKGPGQCAG
eukprot:359927-Chlamydomonas_euryale.AAC.6